MGVTRKLTNPQIALLLKKLEVHDPPLAKEGFSHDEQRKCNRWVIRECEVIAIIRTAIQNFHALAEELGLVLYPTGWMAPLTSIASADASKVVDPMRADAVQREAKYLEAVPDYGNERDFVNRWVRTPPI